MDLIFPNKLNLTHDFTDMKAISIMLRMISTTVDFHGLFIIYETSIIHFSLNFFISLKTKNSRNFFGSFLFILHELYQYYNKTRK